MTRFMYLLLFPLILLIGCQEKKAQGPELWVYTSMYKDTIADLTPRLEKAFPGVTFHWYQAGSEDIATKVNAEIMSGRIQADVMISSDRFWYEDLANQGQLLSYAPKLSEQIEDQFKHPSAFYHTVSIPIMVLCYNKDLLKENELPKSFKDLSLEKFKSKFTTGSPLASGTNFTTMAFLQDKYGWDFFKALKKNETISEGGNSAVLRRIQSGERPIGWVLLENILRFQEKDTRLGVIFPEDGTVLHNNVMAIVKKDDASKQDLAKKFADWMMTVEGQEAMTRSFMHSPFKDVKAPVGAPDLQEILKKSFAWSPELISRISQKRMEIKEKYTEIIFQ